MTMGPTTPPFHKAQASREYRQVPLLDVEDAQTTRSQGTRRAGKSIFFSTSIALLYVCIGLIVGYLCRNPDPTLSAYGINPAIPVPEAVFTERSEVIFQPDYDYIGVSMAADEHWRRLLGDQRNGNKLFVLTPLRQLRCLDTIRKQLGRDGKNNSTVTDYCVEYLRLTVMCGEYWAVEPHVPESDGEELYTAEFGWGLTHSCVDWKELDGWRESQLGLAKHDVQ
ncbi:hypothetical protein SLS56_003645 [Neofusicoccum ribis]|uniref:Uncharacterized protein n=1 Tax=Neofusicoccum ribis TaxID=45134 RepID=A0ABR3SZB4_9PEZI